MVLLAAGFSTGALRHVIVARNPGIGCVCLVPLLAWLTFSVHLGVAVTPRQLFSVTHRNSCERNTRVPCI